MEYRDEIELESTYYQLGYWGVIVTNDYQKVIDLAKEMYTAMIGKCGKSNSIKKVNPFLTISLLVWEEFDDNKGYIKLTGIQTLLEKKRPKMDKLSLDGLNFDGYEILLDFEYDLDTINCYNCLNYDRLNYEIETRTFNPEINLDDIRTYLCCYKNDLIRDFKFCNGKNSFSYYYKIQ